MDASDASLAEFALFGRDEALGALERACQAGARRLAVVGAAGLGKTALAKAFLQRRAGPIVRFQAEPAERRGAAVFFRDALHALGGEVCAPPERRAAALSEALAARPAWIFIDGLERLQYAPAVRGGRVRDAALSAFLASAPPPGAMLLVASRQPVAEFCDAARLDLGPLTPSAGAALLAHRLGAAAGAQSALEQASDSVGGAPLALHSLADALDAAGAARVEAADGLALSARLGAAAARVAEDAARLFRLPKRIAGAGAVERALLAAAALADGPLSAGDRDRLFEDPPIAGLGDALAGLSARARAARLANAARRLGGMGLARLGADEQLEAPPLVRDALAAQAANGAYGLLPTESWRIAKARLFERRRRAAPSHPESRAALAALWPVVRAGAAAGKVAKTFRGQFWDRALRGERRHAPADLGAVDETLAALAPFFAAPWTAPRPELGREDGARALSLAGFLLRGQGRLDEAEATLAAALDWRASWRGGAAAADRARDGAERGECLALLGRLDAARAAVEAALADAEAAGDGSDRRITVRAALAEIHRLGGAPERGLRLLGEAEKIQRARVRDGMSDRPRLYSAPARRMISCLLDLGRREEAQDRARGALQAAEEDGRPLALGLAHLCVAEAEGDAAAADEAVRALRRSERADHLPSALIARAAFGGDGRDLEEAARLARAARAPFALVAARRAAGASDAALLPELAAVLAPRAADVGVSARLGAQLDAAARADAWLRSVGLAPRGAVPKAKSSRIARRRAS